MTRSASLVDRRPARGDAEAFVLSDASVMEASWPPAKRAAGSRSPPGARPRGDRLAALDAGDVSRAGSPATSSRARRPTCLLIDPDPVRRRGTLKYLSTFALDARGAGSSKVARGWLARERFDAIIAYDALPDADGTAFLRWLRLSCPGPILLVARSLDESSRIVALETGASDVVGEACSRRELVARVRALLRLKPDPGRAGTARPPERTSMRFHDLSLDLVYRRLSNESRGMALRLAEAEFRLLCCLLLSSGQVLGREALRTSVYEGQEAVDERTIDVAVSRLRRAIHAMSSIEGILVTVRGEGYRIAATPIQAGNGPCGGHASTGA